MSRVRQLLSDSVILAFGTIGGRAIGLLLLPLYTYALAPSEFGLIEVVTTTVELAVPLLYLCIAEGVLRFAMEQCRRREDVLRCGAVFVGGVTAVLLLAGGLAVGLWWRDSLGWLVLCLVAVQALSVFLGAWARAAGGIRQFALSGLSQAGAIATANIFMLLVFEWGAVGYLVSLIVGHVAAVTVLMVSMPIARSLRQGAWDVSLLKVMLRFSIPLVPNVVFWWMSNISGRYFVAHFQGLDQVGLLSVGSRFPSLVVMVTMVFAQAWQLSAYRSAGDEDRGEFYSRVFGYLSAMLLLGTGSMLLVLRPLVLVATAPAYLSAWMIVPPLLLGAVFSSFSSFYGSIYTAGLQPRGVLRSSVVAAVVSVVLNYVLVPSLGAVGAAISILLSFWVLWLLRLYGSQAVTRTSVSGRLWVGLLLVLAQGGIHYFPVPTGGWSVALLGVCWLGLVWLFRSDVVQVVRSVRQKEGS